MSGRRLRRLVLVVHLIFSLGWIGGAFAYLVLGLAAATSGKPATYVAMWTAMELVGWRALVPLAVGSLASGVCLGLVTPWGLLQHYWVAVSLVATSLATLVLVQHMADVSVIVDRVRDDVDAPHPGGDLVHTLGGLATLLAITGLNVVKPKGLTRRGWRRQQAQRAAERPRTRTP